MIDLGIINSRDGALNSNRLKIIILNICISKEV
ncbi:hypothetical protein CLOBY_33410 [Clostridium saccharobutylicum]|nr:hypothetical protein CLOSC_33990 [Clostridium saccharobutylicum]OAV39057.1 hypothetical protein M945_3507 [Clostridium saccharobutylicum DSM 13864]AQS01577.1 hypothetical protein CSACC_34060 [Clostridium saccharobutylicum]AQS11187.1 hypothetical protein CLOBY_33410 [Clostridium saccharobutylicum]AQS15560.1 hypothetical protein CLOSACC_34060 [Clostridium saccharobutylicum]